MSDITQILEPQVEEKEVVSGGLISKEFFDFSLNAIHDYNRPKNTTFLMKNLKFSNPDYVPLYAINFSVDTGLPVSSIINNSFDIGSYEKLIAAKQGLRAWQENTVYTSFLKKCIEKKLYNVLLFTKHKEDSVVTSKVSLRQNLISRFGEFIDKPVDLRIYREGRNNAKNYGDILENCKYFCDWSKSRTRRASPSDPVVYFLTNFYYMAKLNEHNSNHWIEPMFSVMIKKEHVGFVRACLMTNTPIPVDAMELWIDSNLDRTDSDHKIRPSFIKSIKTPFKNAGVKIVVHEKLFDVLYSRPTLPAFKNVIQKVQWVNDLSMRLLTEERIRLGLETRKEVKVTPEQAAGISDILQAVRSSEVKMQMEEFERLTAELTA
jgi:hypothetical protein